MSAVTALCSHNGPSASAGGEGEGSTGSSGSHSRRLWPRLHLLEVEEYNTIPYLIPLYYEQISFLITPTGYDRMACAIELMQRISGTGELRLYFGLAMEPHGDDIHWNRVHTARGRNIQWTPLHTYKLAEMVHILSGKVVKRLVLDAPWWTSSGVPTDFSNYPFMNASWCEDTLNTLEELAIQVPIIDVPYFRMWAIGSLNASPIRKLTLRAQDVPHAAWTELFFGLQVPHLRHLAIDVNTLHAPTLLFFLVNHPSLQFLGVYQDVMEPDLLYLPSHALPNLRELEGTPLKMSRFLKNSGALASIERVDIVSNGLRTCPDLLHTTHCMESLAARPSRPPIHLSLKVVDIQKDATPTEVSERWIRDEVYPTSGDANEWKEGCAAYKNSWFSKYISCNDDRWPALNVRVLEVTLFDHLRFTTSALYSLPEWVEWCPNVEKVVLQCGAAHFGEEEDTRLVFEVYTKCPSVQQIDVVDDLWGARPYYIRRDPTS
ncbi:hypothetical protein OE88DRAFT_202207 [Heliocybe sulcata]|uniref:F-box domain-containing protein n=1 Tax=Heliocybe sulcata TaxID=5364 RepID=A0A5C3N4D0_9AGAM|nr:hypothetical protein OE88DRAFT_202207 [Heliocybe sulcata]